MTTLFAKFVYNTVENVTDYTSEELYDVLSIIEVMLSQISDLCNPSESTIILCDKFEEIFNKIYNGTQDQDVKEYILEQSSYLGFYIVDDKKRQIVSEVIEILHNIIDLMDTPTSLNTLVEELSQSIIDEATIVKTYKLLERLQKIANNSKIEVYIKELKRTSNI